MRTTAKILTGFALVAFALSTRSAATLLEGKPLAAALAAGGYNILMRLPSSQSTAPTAEQIKPGNIGHERQLDDNGCKASLAMGEALRRLRIPIGKVLSSPAYRALETVALAKWPDPHTYDDLGEAGRNAERAGSLRAQLGVLPDAGTNTVIITHALNIADAVPEDAKDLTDGEALVYRPDGHGKAALVARLKIEDWPKLAGSGP